MPGLKDLYPIGKAADLKPSWTKAAAINYRQKKQAIPNKKITTVLKCPGIIDYMRTGYILYNYFDFAVRSENANSQMMLDMTLDQSRLFAGSTGLGRYLDIHTPDTLSAFMPPPVGANTNILKISTAWRIKAPADTVFLELPVFFSGENRFITVGGILDPRDSGPINPSFWWLANDDKWHIVKAGQPLVQYIPMKRNSELEFQIRDATEKEKENNKIYDIMLHSSFTTNIKSRREKTDKIFKDNQ